jgi:CRP-like cAMP-binding protein
MQPAQQEEAEKHLQRGEFSEALRHYTSILEAAPHYSLARLGVAQALAGLRDASAKDIFVASSRHALRFGVPLVGLFGISRLAQERDARASVLAREAATLYAGIPQTSLYQDKTQPPANLTELPFVDVVSLAKRLALQEAEPPEGIVRPSIPLLSQLPKAAFAAICLLLKTVELQDQQLAYSQQNPGAYFYLIVSGGLSLLRRQANATQDEMLGAALAGSCAGETSLLSEALYSSSAKAINPTKLLQIQRETFSELSKKIPEIGAIVQHFARERLLRTLLATAPIFRPFPKKRRVEVVRLFTGHDVNSNTQIIAEGHEGRGLYVIISGQVEVTIGPEKNVLATLQSGDLFGEMSLLKKRPTNASVWAKTPSQLLFLSRENFWKLLENEPALKEFFQKLSDDRAKATEQMLAVVEEISVDEEFDEELEFEETP